MASSSANSTAATTPQVSRDSSAIDLPADNSEHKKQLAKPAVQVGETVTSVLSIIMGALVAISPLLAPIQQIPGIGIGASLIVGVSNLYSSGVARGELGDFFIENALSITLMVENSFIYKSLLLSDSIKMKQIYTENCQNSDTDECNGSQNSLKIRIENEVKTLINVIEAQQAALLIQFARCVLDERKNTNIDVRQTAFKIEKTGIFSKLHRIVDVLNSVDRTSIKVNRLLISMNVAISNLIFI
jgi:hypothetical protein